MRKYNKNSKVSLFEYYIASENSTSYKRKASDFRPWKTASFVNLYMKSIYSRDWHKNDLSDFQTTV